MERRSKLGARAKTGARCRQPSSGSPPRGRFHGRHKVRADGSEGGSSGITDTTQGTLRQMGSLQFGGQGRTSVTDMATSLLEIERLGGTAATGACDCDAHRAGASRTRVWRSYDRSGRRPLGAGDLRAYI